MFTLFDARPSLSFMKFMSESQNHSSFLLHSWLRKADQWIEMLHDAPLPEFRQRNDDALLQRIKSYKPRSVLVLGSADGAVVDACIQEDISAVGIDVYEEFIEFASSERQGIYHKIDTDAPLSSVLSKEETFDVMVFSFGFFTYSTMLKWLREVKTFCTHKSTIIVQAMHPTVQALTERPYKSGWQPGNWMDGKDNGTDSPFPWFFRTLEDWFCLFSRAGFEFKKLSEPLEQSASHRPLSLIFELSVIAK